MGPENEWFTDLAKRMIEDRLNTGVVTHMSLLEMHRKSIRSIICNFRLREKISIVHVAN